MKPIQLKRRSGAFTLIELLCVIGIIGILSALLLPALNRGKSGAKRVQCVGNLKQTGIAFLSFAHDHKDRFPMQTPAGEGGTLEFVQSGYQIPGPFYFSFRHFAAISNELITPKPLLCPTEELRFPAENFQRFGNDHLSYFAGVTAEPQRPLSILAGDRNITNITAGGATLVRQPYGSAIHWTAELHRYRGNLLFADGHVEERNERELAAAGSHPLGDVVLPTPPAAGASSPSTPTYAAHAPVNHQPPNQDGANAKPSEPSDSRDPLPVRAKTLPAVVTVPAGGLPSSAADITSTPPAPAVQDSTTAPAQSGSVSLASVTKTTESESIWKNPFLWLLYLLLLCLLAIVAAGLRRHYQRET